MATAHAIRSLDFEKLGYNTMFETGDDLAARDICGQKIMELEADITPDVVETETQMQTKRGQSAALHSHLYDRNPPASDAAMLARSVKLKIFIALFVLVCAASVASHTLTFYFFGFGLLLSAVLGIALTGIVLAVGHYTFEDFIIRYKTLETALVVGAFALCFWGLVQMALTRGSLAAKALTANTSSESTSYVEDATADAPSSGAPASGDSEENLRQLLSSAILKIMIAADMMLGVLFGTITVIRKDEDYASWHYLNRLAGEIGSLEKRNAALQSLVEIAKRRCAAGILRSKSIPRKKHVPFHHLPLLFMVAVFGVHTAVGQNITRQEAILLDVSGSIGRGPHPQLLREYLTSIKHLLAEEPPNSRVYVSVISTDSFGSVRELVKGWTPEQKGIFTDDLSRARRQLVASLEAKAAGMSAVAAGTDIFGGLWHVKALLESGSASISTAKDLWIFSDMVNETPELQMPALLSLGPEQMLEKAKAHKLVVPLRGYQVHIIGASTAGLTPRAWNITKTFWTLYFREAGAVLVSYSADSIAERF